MTNAIDEIRARWEAVSGEDWEDDGNIDEDVAVFAPGDVARLLAEIDAVRAVLRKYNYTDNSPAATVDTIIECLRAEEARGARGAR